MTSPRQRQQLADDVLEAFHLSGLKQPFLEMEFVWLKCSYDNEHFVDVKQHLHKLLSENKATINLVSVHWYTTALCTGHMDMYNYGH